MSDTQGRYRIGVDVGGTFTDAAVFDDAAGSLRYAKVPSTPADPARAVLDVLDRLGVDFGEVQRFIHGITIGTNAVLEGQGAEVWMLTTAGFRDVLEIARTNRTVLYDITALKPPPLVPRGRTLEIDERMAWDGSVLRPLDLDQARAAVQSLPSGAAVAVCFLHSYANRTTSGRWPRSRARAPAGTGPGRDSSPPRARCCRSSGSTSASIRPPSMRTSAPSSTATWPGSRLPSPPAATAARCSS